MGIVRSNSPESNDGSSEYQKLIQQATLWAEAPIKKKYQPIYGLDILTKKAAKPTPEPEIVPVVSEEPLPKPVVPRKAYRPYRARQKPTFNPSRHIAEIVPEEIRTLPTFPFSEDGSRRWCYRCVAFRDKEEFRRGYGSCKQCMKRAPDVARDANYRQNYNGFTLAQYNVMLKAQHGVCAVCGRKETKVMRGKVIPLSIDHCHKTNRIRALLCSDCNLSFGYLKEDPERIQRLLEYARKWQES